MRCYRIGCEPFWCPAAAGGVDPIKERGRQAREAARPETTLARIAEDTFEARKAELKADGKAGRWFSQLALHVLPKLARIPVQKLTQRDVRDALGPVWHAKPETARKALTRLKLCLDHGARWTPSARTPSPPQAATRDFGNSG